MNETFQAALTENVTALRLDLAEIRAEQGAGVKLMALDELDEHIADLMDLIDLHTSSDRSQASIRESIAGIEALYDDQPPDAELEIFIRMVHRMASSIQTESERMNLLGGIHYRGRRLIRELEDAGARTLDMVAELTDRMGYDELMYELWPETKPKEGTP